VRYFDIHEDDQLDEAQLATWPVPLGDFIRIPVRT